MKNDSWVELGKNFLLFHSFLYFLFLIQVYAINQCLSFNFGKNYSHFNLSKNYKFISSFYVAHFICPQYVCILLSSKLKFYIYNMKYIVNQLIHKTLFINCINLQ